MNKKTVIITLLAALALMLVLGCSRSRKEATALYAGGATKTAYGREMDAAMSEAVYEQAAAYDGDWDGIRARPAEAAMFDDSNSTAYISFNYSGNTTQTVDAAATPAEVGNAERKLAKSAYLRIRVENLDAADASVTGLLQKYDAYAASTVVEENSRTYSLRVPAPRYDAFLAEMNGMGRLLTRSENTEDVTLRYYDLEGRLETKKELLKTFQSYLGKAKTIEEILAVEARISELQYDIEGTGKQFRNLANRVDYAIIDLHLIGPVAAAQNRSETLGERLKRMFGGFVDFLSGVVGAIVGIVIYGIPTLLLVFFFFWLLFGRIGLLRRLWRLVRAKK